MTTTVSSGPPSVASPNRRTQAMLDGRHIDTAHRRQRVITAMERGHGSEISISSIARAAAVSRSFLYRHPDLLESIHALACELPATAQGKAVVTRASLEADLLAAHERAARLNARVQHLERRLSEALGEQAWRESGLGTPADIGALQHQITHLEQQLIDLRLQLDERDEDLAAARAANRELMTRINAPSRDR